MSMRAAIFDGRRTAVPSYGILADADNELIGLHPHFMGESVVRVRLTARVDRPEGTVLDGAFHGWADPADGGDESGAYPFVFDVPDFARHASLELTTIVRVQIAAFSHEISLFDSEAAYDASQRGEIKFSSQSFIPSGLFAATGETTSPPAAHGIFTGHILKAETRQNSLMGHSFYWALVDSLGGTFDVVIDPELVEGPPKLGGVLTGSFWLSGRIID